MKIKDTLHIVAGVILIIIGAYVSINIGPVPFVLTNFFIILVGLIIGWKKVLIAIVVYIALGVIGLPVFSGGKGGLVHFIGLTGGFIIGFIPLACLSGLAKGKSLVIQILLILVGTLLVFIIGTPWAYNHYNTIMVPASSKRSIIDFTTGLKFFVTPYILPDLIKLTVAVVIAKVINPVLKPFIGA